MAWLLLRFPRQFRFSAATKSVVNRPQYKIASGTFVTFSSRCGSLPLYSRPADRVACRHVRRALRLTPSGGEPVPATTRLGRRGAVAFGENPDLGNGDVEVRGRLWSPSSTNRPPCGSSSAREACEISMSESGIDRAADLASQSLLESAPARTWRHPGAWGLRCRGQPMNTGRLCFTSSRVNFHTPSILRRSES